MSSMNAAGLSHTVGAMVRLLHQADVHAKPVCCSWVYVRPTLPSSCRQLPRELHCINVWHISHMG